MVENELVTFFLEDGTICYGISFGSNVPACGEVVFNTSMSGYQEMITDCSYKSQILVLTCPHIGNVGVNYEDIESNQIHIAALVIKELSPIESNWRKKGNLHEYLKKQGIPGIYDVDTRGLTHKLREKGCMKRYLLPGKLKANEILLQIKMYNKNNVDIITKYSLSASYIYSNKMHITSSIYRIVVYDFGIKLSILESLKKLGCYILVVPNTTSLSELLKLRPDGIVLSNGPGNPETYIHATNLVKKLLDTNIPILGICLGHQLLAIANNAFTIKMKYGHHGSNHPVQDLRSKKIIITSQNHNFIIDETTMPNCLVITHRSLFDGSIQGFCHKNKPIIAFQGHPEGGPGPVDGSLIFSHYLNMVKSYKLQCQKEMI